MNHACIPVKYLRYATEILHYIEKAPRYGIHAGVAKVDWKAVQRHRRALIDSQVAGLGELLSARGVRVVRGEARQLKDKTVLVEAGGAAEAFSAPKIILATGSVPAGLDIPGIEYALYYHELLELDALPSSLAIIGGGPVGVELATIFSGFGSGVSVVEMMPQVLPGEDRALVAMLAAEMKKRGVRLYTGATVTRIEKSADGYRVALKAQGEEQRVEAAVVALCIGQQPSTGGIDFLEPGVIFERGAIKVDEYLQTSARGIYAVGDVTGRSMLAYVGIMQGRLAAENALGGRAPANYSAVPRCLFTRPELAGVGLTEEEARAKGFDVKVGSAPFAANPAATIYGERRGQARVVIDSASSRLLGVHILGPQAATLIHEAVLPVRLGLPVTELQRSLHAHPNLAEAVWEAALAITG
jgi:dihydrolipoamide dehydrogenase